VIEFNARLGDPEAQVVLPLIDEPLLPLLVAGAAGALRPSKVRIGTERFAGVVLASRGYPESAESGRPIQGIEQAEMIEGVAVYHAGTAMRDGQLVTARRPRAHRRRPRRRLRRGNCPRLRRRDEDRVRRHAVPSRHRAKSACS